MKKMKTIIQIIFVVAIWYCFYSKGGWKSVGFDGGKMNLALLWSLYVLPMILIGVVLNIFTYIDNRKEKQPIQKLNLLIEGVFVLILVVVPVIVIQKFPVYDMISEDMQSIAYQKLNFSDLFGMSAYMATGLCAGHMVGMLAEKPRKVIVKYISIILFWFVTYDILLPMTAEMTKSGRNYTLSTLLTILPMLFAGIVLAYRERYKSNQRKRDKFHFILLIIIALMALTVPVNSILMDLKIFLYGSQNIIVSMIQFVQVNSLYIVFWLCVGDVAAKLNGNE